ncbi:MAG TPA: FAD-binding oxidoreductase [Gemmatimonadaceae bacterium]|nr:FAD-binding oxidoreductase [Gemmatimonadaceae bacterium]
MRAPTGFSGPFRTDHLARALYAEGAGIARVIPDAVAVPRDGDDVAALVRWAWESGTPLVPRGSGSGMAGGAVGGGVLVDLSRLRSMSAVEVERRRLWVGAGVLRDEVNEKARDHRLRFPVDPSSGAFCTIGGMIGTNAAGAHTLRHGATRAWVSALDCVFEDGSRAVLRRGDAVPRNVAAIGRVHQLGGAAVGLLAPALAGWPAVRKNSSGYAVAESVASSDLVDLVIGSEGTLAFVVAAELMLDRPPQATGSVLAAFSSLDAAAEGAQLARAAGASACELLDRTFLALASTAAAELPSNTAAVLLSNVEGSDTKEARAASGALGQALARAGATLVNLALESDAEGALWSLRHAASPILSRLDPSPKSMQLIEDGCVPPDRLADYVRGVRDALASAGIRGVIFGHAGDAHVHVNALVDVRLHDWRTRVSALLDEVTALVTALGGTLAGEHGDGRLRTPLLHRIWSTAAMRLFAEIKASFDPRGILNPGVKVPSPDQQPLGDIKYDPDLAPLPAAARAALDRIERQRAWSTFRLSLADG